MSKYARFASVLFALAGSAATLGCSSDGGNDAAALDDGANESAIGATSYPVDSASANQLPEPLLRAVLELRNRTAANKLSDRGLYDYAYYVIRNEDGIAADELAKNVTAMAPIAQKSKEALAARVTETGRSVDALFAEQLAPYLELVRIAYAESPAKDRDSVRLARSGKEAYNASAFLNCVDYAKALAYRARGNGMKAADMKLFVTMDSAGYTAMCPAGSEGKALAQSVARPVVHTLVAYRHQGDWYAVSPEMDLGKTKLEIFRFGATLPDRMSRSMTLEQAPFVAGKVLVNAGAFSFDDALLNGAISSQTLKNITANGTMSAAGRASDQAAQYVCTHVVTNVPPAP